jgi:hypothetical protein
MKPEPLSEDELLQALQSEAAAACGFYDTTVYEEQAQAIKYYQGEPFGDEVEGLSQIVLKDVAETVDYMTISVGRLFVSGDRVCEFEAKAASEAEAADQATAALHQMFMQEQDGYRILMDWLKAGLIEKYCATKTARLEEENVSTKVFTATEEEMAAADAQGMLPDDADITDNGDGTFRVKVKQKAQKTRFYDYPLPSEEFRFSARARHEDDADYLAHVSRKTRSELVEMGFDKDMVYELSTEDDLLTDQRRAARDDWQHWRDDNVNASMQEVTLWEEYIKIDADGDGIAERLKVFRVADKILSVDEVDDHPFVIFTPFPRPHRIVGDGLADKTMDIQRIRSVVARQLMNGMYLSNMPRYWLPKESDDGVNTISDLLTVIPGSPVRGKGTPPTPMNAGFDVGRSINVMEFWTGERESRTGITRLNQGLDADALNKTASGTAMMQAQGQQFEEYIARNFAECFARLMWKKYRLVKEFGTPFKLKMDGEYQTVDPALWPDEPDMVIRVGMGTGRKEYRLALRMQLLEIQREGLELGMVTKEHLFNNAGAIVRDAGLGQPDDYFANPAKQAEPDAPKPDPEMAKVEAEAQLQAQKLQGEQAMSAAKMQMQRDEAALKMQLSREQAEADAQLARDKAEFEVALAERRFAFEQQMAERQFEQEARLSQQRADNDAQMKKYREGGDLDK